MKNKLHTRNRTTKLVSKKFQHHRRTLRLHRTIIQEKLRKKKRKDVLKALTEYKDIIEEISPKSISFQEASHELIKLFEKINETIPIDQVTTGISII